MYLIITQDSYEGVGVPVPPSHAGHQVSLGSNTNATIAGMQICFTPCILCVILYSFPFLLVSPPGVFSLSLSVFFF